MARFTGESMALVIPSMAVEPSELSCSNSMDLPNNEKRSKEHDDRGKDVTPHWPGSSRVQSCLERWRFSLLSVSCAGSSRR